MTALGYQNYEEYRQETSRRMPKTVEAHQKKLTKTIASLYQQKDYRALEALLILAEALADDSTTTARHTDILQLMQRTPAAPDDRLRICNKLIQPAPRGRACRKEA